MYKISKLKNGLRIATCKIPKANSCTLGVWICVGGRYEQRQHSGISHFLEHLVFKGTRKRSFKQIKQEIEGLGGELNGFTSEEVTCFLAKVLWRHTKTALDVLLDITFNSRIPESEISRERMVIFEEIKMYHDLPQYLAYDQFQSMLWPQQPLGRNLAGDFKSLQNINKKVLMDYKKTFYKASNIVICASGNLNHDAMLKDVKGIMRKISGKAKTLSNPGIFEANDHAKAQTKFIRKRTKQVHFYLGTHAFNRYDPMCYALVLLHIILGANMSSRLFNEVREKNGYAYEIGTGLKKLVDTGAFYIHAGVVKEKTEAALKLVLKELKKIAKSTVSADELKRAKEYYCGQLLLGLEDTMQHMIWMGDKVIFEKNIPRKDSILRKVNSVKASDIRSVARRVFLENKLKLSVVGPLSANDVKRLSSLIEGFH